MNENRANKKDRPKKVIELKEVPLESKCKEKGHEHVFKIGDRYGWCKVCGDEVLT